MKIFIMKKPGKVINLRGVNIKTIIDIRWKIKGIFNIITENKTTQFR